MKKLTRKLFLSIAALAVCAATLVSTTFAWYVSNSTANVKGLTGAILSGGSEGNILVAKDVGGSAGNFTQTLTMDASENELDPMTKGEGGDKPETSWYDATGVEYESSEEHRIVYTFWILSTKETNLTIEATLENTTKTFKKQTLFSTDGKPTAVGEGEQIKETATAPTKYGDTFAADAVNALECVITEYDSDTDTAIESNQTHAGLLKGLMPTYASPKDCVTGGDANVYYKSVMSKAAYGTAGFGQADQTTALGNSTDASAVSWSSMTLTAGVARKISIEIWLEGSNSACWDSCKGQSFSLQLDFKVAGPGA